MLAVIVLMNLEHDLPNQQYYLTVSFVELEVHAERNGNVKVSAGGAKGNRPETGINASFNLRPERVRTKARLLYDRHLPEHHPPCWATHRSEWDGHNRKR